MTTRRKAYRDLMRQHKRRRVCDNFWPGCLLGALLGALLGVVIVTWSLVL